METFPKEMVAFSLKKCVLTIDDNGDKDDQISCFKLGRPCADGCKVLKEQVMIFSEQKNMHNLFEITESKVEDAQFADNIISDDEEDDVDID